MHRTLPGALMCFTAPMRSTLEETNCLTKPSKAWTGCCLFIKESCHSVASFFDSRGCFLAQNACTEATNSSAARRPCEAFLKKRTVWQSLAEPELGMFLHQRIMCHGRHVFCFLASVFLRKMPVRKLLQQRLLAELRQVSACSSNYYACDSCFRFLLCVGIFFCFTATISRHKYK